MNGKTMALVVLISWLAMIILYNSGKVRHVTSDDILSPRALDKEIARNISVPFKDYDTLVYQTYFEGRCGTFTPDDEELEEIRKGYIPSLDSLVGIMSLHIQKPVIFFDGLYRKENWNRQISLTVAGYTRNPDLVIIDEHYNLGNVYANVVKAYTYKKGEWHGKTIFYKKEIPKWLLKPSKK